MAREKALLQRAKQVYDSIDGNETVSVSLPAPNESEEAKAKQQPAFRFDPRVFTRIGQAEDFVARNPLFYDRAGLWWVWNAPEKKWGLVDETDVLNSIFDALSLDTVSSRSRSEILNALKQVGRRNIPQPTPPAWIQFKSGIVDLDFPDKAPFEPTSSFFVTNPNPWEMGDSEDTPTMDRIFTEWVNAEHVQTLYEILAYCLLPDYPIHRIFCFIGAGMNGKSKFLDLLRNFVGEDIRAFDNCSLGSLSLEAACVTAKCLLLHACASERHIDDRASDNEEQNYSSDDQAFASALSSFISENSFHFFTSFCVM